VASIGSHIAPGVALERTVSAIASARRAVLADRHATGSLAVEWRWFADLVPFAGEWRDLAARALEPNVFHEPAFALAAAAVFGHDVGAVLVWSGSHPRKLLGFFPARVTTRRYGVKLPVLVGWTQPYAPLGTPLVDRETAEPVIAAWIARRGYLAASIGAAAASRRRGSIGRDARQNPRARANAVRRFRAPPPRRARTAV
jgi:hypothetical protein